MTAPETMVRERALAGPHRRRGDDDRRLTELYLLGEIEAETGRPAHLIGAREWARWRARRAVKIALDEVDDYYRERR